jgi:hypothetical protein
MPSLQDLFDTINLLLGLPVALLVGAAAVSLAAAQDWRALLAMLMAQTVGLAILGSQLIPPEWAVIQVVVVGFVAIMWFLSARTVVKYAQPRRSLTRRLIEIWARARRRGRRLLRTPRQAWTPSRWLIQGLRPSFRFLVVAIVGVAAYAERAFLTLPGLPPELSIVCAWVLIMALAGLALSNDPLRVGLALMSGLSVFHVLYLNLAPSTQAVGILGGLTLLAGLACSYLIVARGALAWPREGEDA